MALQFEVDSLEGLDESLQALYTEHEGKYRLSVEGIDPADELKEALRKEREERAAAKARLKEFEDQQSEAERKRLEEKQEFEQLYKQSEEGKGKLARELDDLKRQIADKERSEVANGITAALTRDTARAELLQKEALQFVHYTPEGVKINGPDGEAWDKSKLSEYLTERYPFLVDGSLASGGGAAGSKGSGAARKPLSEMTQDERIKFKQEDPEGFRKALNLR